MQIKNKFLKNSLITLGSFGIISLYGSFFQGKGYNFIKQRIENSKEKNCKPVLDTLYEKAIIVNPYSEERKIKRGIKKISEKEYISNMIFESKDINDSLKRYYRFKIYSDNKDSLKNLLDKIQYGDILEIELGIEQHGCNENGRLKSNLDYYEDYNWYIGNLKQDKIKKIQKNI